MSEDVRFRVVLGDGFAPEENGLELTFTYRLLGREDYRGILQDAETEAEIDEFVCMLCVEEPYDWRGGLAGPATAVAECILASSGLAEGQSEMLLEHFRHELYTSPDYQRDCMIVEAFPNLDIEEVQNWPVVKQLYYFSRAEYILSVIRGKKIRFIDAEQVEAAEAVQRVPRPSERVTDEIPEEWRTPEPAPSQPAPQEQPKGQLTEAELMAMLGATSVSTTLDHESMNYYKHKDELTGDYD